MRLRDTYPAFLEHCRDKELKTKTIHEHKKNLDNIIDPVLGDIYFENLTLNATTRIREVARDFGTSAPCRSAVTLRQLLKFATREGLPVPFDWREVEVPRYRVQHPSLALTRKEIRVIREVIETMTNPNHDPAIYQRYRYRTRALFELILHTGMRIEEAISLKRSDLDFEKNEIRFTNCKTGERECIYLYGSRPSILRYLNARNDSHPTLFFVESYWSNGGVMSKDTAKSNMRLLNKRLKGKLRNPLGWNVIRKTYSTELLRKGVDLKSVQYLARHKSIRTTINHYVTIEKEFSKKEHKRVMEKSWR